MDKDASFCDTLMAIDDSFGEFFNNYILPNSSLFYMRKNIFTLFSYQSAVAYAFSAL